MQLFEVKNDIAKVIYNPAENHLLPSDFLLIEDVNQKLIAQIINIETTDDSNNNLAYLRFAISIDKEDNLSYYNGYIPARDSKIIYINPDEIMELLKGNGQNIYFGNLAKHPDCFVKPSISLLTEKLYIRSDRNDKTEIIIQNIITELQNKNKNVILIDFDGRYKNIKNAVKIKISDNFKLPLNIDAFNTILEYDIVDCPLEDKALIQSIVLELREYIQTLNDKFLPFNMFKKVVEEELINNPISGLMLFRNKLWLYAQDRIFAENKSQFDFINASFKNSNVIIIDASLIEEKWHKFVVQTILSLVSEYCCLVLSLNDIILDKKSIINLYNKENIIPVVSTTYSSNYSEILKSICKNQLLCKPLKYIEDDELYTTLLNKINSDEFILFGETTLYLPIPVEIQSFTEETEEEIIDKEIKKDVDKLLSSPQTVIPKEADIQTINNNIQESEEIVEDDDLTDSDLDFLDETLNNPSIPQNQEELSEYDVFVPIDKQEHEINETVETPEDILESIDASEELLNENPEDILQDVNEEQIITEPNDENTEDIEQIEEDAETDEVDEDISPLDDVIKGITDKLEEEKNEADNLASSTEEIKEHDDLVVEFESDEDEKEENVQPPEINENIKPKTSPEIPVYETDDSSSVITADIPFKIGDVVYHPKHGKGVIEGFANYSNKILFCQIEFENVGRRILDPRIAGIEKVS